MAAAIAITRWGWQRIGGDPELPDQVAMWGFPAGLIGGRIYFDVTTPSQVPDHWWGVFAIWQGGLGIWGGIAGGVAGGWFVLRKQLPPAKRAQFIDVAAPGLLVAQAIGRIGNYFNQELFGAPSNLPWALQIAPAHRPAGYLAYRTFEPTFLYELIWNLLLAGALVWLGKRRRVRAPGLFALYVAGYSGFRVFRGDPAHRLLHFLPGHATQLLDRLRALPARNARLCGDPPSLVRQGIACENGPGGDRPCGSSACQDRISQPHRPRPLNVRARGCGEAAAGDTKSIEARTAGDRPVGIWAGRAG